MISRKRWSGTYTRTSQRTDFCKSTSKNRLDGYTKCGEAGSGRRDGPHTEASFKDVAYCGIASSMARNEPPSPPADEVECWCAATRQACGFSPATGTILGSPLRS